MESLEKTGCVDDQHFREGLVVAILALFVSSGSLGLSQNHESTDRKVTPASLEKSSAADFKVMKEACTEQNKVCMAFVYLDADSFNENDLKSVGYSLGKRYQKKIRVSAFLFDNEETAFSHIKNNRHPTELSDEARGMYVRSTTEEYIKYSEEMSAPFTWNSRIDLKSKSK